MKNKLIYVIAFTTLLFSNEIKAQIYPGSIDETFDVGSGFDKYVSDIKLQPDGKVLLGGGFEEYNGYSSKCLIRLNSNGSIDTTFNVGTGFNTVPTPPISYQPYISQIALQSDGKIIVGGHFTNYNGQTQKSIVRLNSNGILDSSFNVDNSFNNCHIYNVVLQPSGKILVSGWFIIPNSQPKEKLIRLNEDGSIDTSFNEGLGNNIQSFKVITLQSDGKILVGGNFTTFNNLNYNRIIRLNSNGTVDSSFDTGSGFNFGVESISLQTDNKILVGGRFSQYNGQLKNYILRLYPDGNLDNSFNVNYTFEGVVNTIVIQPNGKILAGGGFSTNVYGQTKISRLNTNGSIDVYFNSGAGFPSTLNKDVSSISLQPDGKIIVAGNFTGYNGISKNRIVRLKGGESALNLDKINNDNSVKLYPNPFKYELHLSSDNQIIQEINVIDMTGKIINTFRNINANQYQLNASSLTTGKYIIQINTDEGVEVHNVIKK